MNDDEFLSQFRKTPRPEFVAALRDSLAQQDADDEGDLMTTIPTPDLSDPRPAINIARPRNRVLPLVAACLVAVFVGIALALNLRPAQMPVPLVPMGLPNPPTLSANNVAQLHPIAQIGTGSIYEAVWSPDGKWLVMAGSMGLWVYDANDLTRPLYNIYPDAYTYAYVAFSGDSRMMAVDSNQGLKIWNLVETLDVTPDFTLVPQYPRALALNSTGSILAAADASGHISFYTVETGRLMLKIKALDAIDNSASMPDMQFSPDDQQLAFLGEGNAVFLINDPTGLWDKDGKLPLRLMSGKITKFQSINYNHDGTRLAGRAGNTIIIWDTTTGEEVQRFQSTASQSNLATAVYGVGGDLSFSPDGTQLMTLGNQMRFWDLATETSRTLPGSDEGLYYTSLGLIHIKPDWSQVAVVMRGGLTYINNVATGDSITMIDDYTLNNINELALSRDGTRMVTAGDLRQVLTWDIRDVSHVPPPEVVLDGFDADFYDGQRHTFNPKTDVLTMYRTTGNIQLWTEANTVLQEWTVPSYQRDTSRSAQGFIAYNADGTRLLSTSPDGAHIWLWDMDTGAVIQTLDLDPSLFATIGALSPDGQQIAVGMNVEEMKVVDGYNNNQPISQMRSVIVIYDAATGEALKTLEFHSSQIHRLIYSPDGKTLLSSDMNSRLYLWDVTTGDKVILSEKNLTHSFDFSPDGTLIAGMECFPDIPGCDLILWDAASQTRLVSLHGDALIQDLVFSADGTRLFTALNNGTVRVWGLQ